LFAAVACVMAVPAVAQPSAAAQAAADVPSQITEQYGDWAVTCKTPTGGAKQCLMTQQLNEQKSGRQVVRVEIAAAGKDGMQIVRILAPFGIMISDGIELMADERTALRLPVATCMPPQGCIGRLAVTARDLAPIRKAKALAVRFRPYADDAGPSAAQAPLSFPLSTAGMGSGLDRLAVMSR